MKREHSNILVLITMLGIVFFSNLMAAGSGVLSFNEFKFSNYVFSNIRFTKALTALFCGVSLPLAGQILQVLFRNPLAGPYVLGISSGSSFFVALTVMFFGYAGVNIEFIMSKFTVVTAAFAGSLFCTFLVLIVARSGISNAFLMLVGLMIGQIFGAMQSLVEYYSSDKNLKEFILWGYGSLGNCNYEDLYVFAGILLVLCLLLAILTKPFQVMLLGENYANTLGVEYKKYRMLFIIISSLLTGLATAFCGPIAFIGLSVPIITRLLFRTSDQKYVLVYNVLIGASIMLLCDLLSYVLVNDRIIPINVITTIAGSPFVIYLLFKNKNW